MTFLETLQKQVLVLDGAMGTEIQALGLTDTDFGGTAFRMLSDLLCLSRPEAVQRIHLDYLRAGANAIETNTFGSSAFRLSEYDFRELDLSTFPSLPGGVDPRTLSYDDLAYTLSRAGAEIACRARDEHRASADYDGRPLSVIGSMGPSNRVVSSTQADLKRATFDEIAANFAQQTLGLIDGGAEVLLFETQQDILELKAAVFGAKQAMVTRGVALPIMAQVTVDTYARMQIFNTDIHAALVTLQHVGIDVFGINCSIGPDLMARSIETLARFSSLPISVVPNAGLPTSENGRTVFSFDPELFAKLLSGFVRDHGVAVVGGCCGTTPEHIRLLVNAVRGVTPRQRRPEPGLYVSGPQEAIRLDSSKALILIGERLNVRGSKAVRDAVEGEAIDHHALEEVVLEQVRDLGVKVIDVCMDSNVVDTTEVLSEVVHRQTTDFAGAMSIDSFAVEALAAAIKMYPGRPIINSISVEEVAPGRTKLDEVIEATKGHGPIYIGLATGPKGPGATREEKYDLAKAIVEGAARHGVGPDQLFIDMNVFPIGSESVEGMNFALESLEAIPLIKRIHPELRTVCGVGNLTNGLAKKPYMRKVLTSVWLDEARKRGLDAAIINPNHYVFVNDLDPRDYALGLRAVMERDMEAYAQLEVIAEEKKGHVVARRTSYDDLDAEAAICEKIVDGFKEREEGTIEIDGHAYRYTDRIVLQAAEVLARHEPLAFINEYLMRAMQDLGDGFARGDVSLPHLLKSADVMKQVMGFFEEYLRVRSGADLHAEIQYKGTVVIGTVYQDVHSIGKDLAKTLFENYGYRVIDLGVMTPLQQYLDAAREHNADAIGMSALLVQTSNHMITVARMMEEQGLAHLPVLIGGAPVNYRHAAYVAMAGQNNPNAMRDNVFYCPTAMDGVNVMNTLMGGHDTQTLLGKNRDKLLSNLERAEKMSREEDRLLRTLPRRTVSFEQHTLPTHPYQSPQRVAVPLTEFRASLDTRTLFALNWKFGGSAARARQGETPEKLQALFDEWTTRAGNEGWIQPQGVYALFPCLADGDEVIVYALDDPAKEIARFDFTVVLGGERRDTVCAAEYFRPVGSPERDVIGVQLSTSGPQVDEQLRRFREAGDSESLLYLQGLSDRVAEDMADWLHAIQRAQLGFDAKHGIRWSPGYPAMTNTDNNRRILELLDATAHTGVRLTEAGEFSPTGSTAAVVCFHPDARYT